METNDEYSSLIKEKEKIMGQLSSGELDMDDIILLEERLKEINMFLSDFDEEEYSEEE